jgi:predicted metal-dependent hydrolase
MNAGARFRPAATAQLRLFEPWPLRERVSARARRMRIDVRPDGEVVLTLPARASREAALRFLEQSRGWIERTRARMARGRAAEPLPWDGPRERSRLRALALEQARRLLDEEAARLGLRYRGLAIRDPRTRWGSCGPRGDIMLSLRLAMAPPEVFRYVAVHELCHLRWRGHGPRFWALVARQMPDYEAARAWLRASGARLHAIPLT